MNKTRIITYIRISSFLILILLFFGCIKENFDSSKFDTSLSLKSGLAIPVGFSHLTAEKYLSDTSLNEILRISKDGFLSLYYSTIIDSGVMEDMYSINDASVIRSVINPTASVIFLNIPGVTLNLSDSIFIPVSGTQTNARIDSIKLLSGILQLNLSSASLTGTITFQIDGLEQNGVTFSATRSLANPDITISLAGYSIIPGHDIAGNNLLKCKMTVQLQSPSGPVNPGATILDIQADLINISYETIYGDFGGYTIDIPSQTISTPFFSQFINGQIIFTDPKIKLYFANSVGVPFGISFSSIDAINRNNNHFALTGAGVPTIASPKIIRYPAMSQAGQIITDSLVLDKGNSNLSAFIATTPDSITIDASATINSLTPPATSFINHDSKYKVSTTIELPLQGKADIMILLDTIDFDYLSSAIPPPKEIEKLIVRISITNSFPVTVYPQIYLIDENFALLDSLFTGTEKIEGANDTNSDGKADPLKQSPVDIDLPRSRIDNLLNTRYLVTKGKIMTTDFPAHDVKFYSTYFLDYNVGVIAQLKIKTGK